MPLSGVEQRVCELIRGRGAALLEDLRLHVGLPTGRFHAPGLDRTRGLLCDRLARLGASVSLEAGDPAPEWLSADAPPAPPPTAVCSRLDRPGRRILLVGHLDTVHDPAGSFRELSIAPDGKTATGPGCVDMKGGLVIAVAALEALEEAGVPVAWTFAFNSDEETGTFHSDRALRKQARAHDFGLVFEPAMPDGGLVVERPGSGQFLLEARGTPAHVGRDFAKGASAVSALAQAIVAADRCTDVAGGRIVNVAPIEGGEAPNIVASSARGWGNVRFRDEGVGADLERDLAALACGSPAGPIELRVRTAFNRPAKPLTPAVQALAERARAAAADLGQKLPFGRTGGVCDGNNLQAEGLPTIDTLGVRGGGLHTPQEWIELGSLVERCQLAAVLIHRLSAGIE